MPRNRKFLVTVDRTTLDRVRVEVEAPTYDVAESRALVAADKGVVWTEVEETSRVVAINEKV